MTAWSDVCALAERLPRAQLGEAHEGSPAWYVGRHPFARLRWDDDGHELLQVWTGDMDTERALADRREDFPVIWTYSKRVTMWCRLDLLGPRETAELVLDSYGIRGGPGPRQEVLDGNYLPPGD